MAKAVALADIPRVESNVTEGATLGLPTPRVRSKSQDFITPTARSGRGHSIATSSPVQLFDPERSQAKLLGEINSLFVDLRTYVTGIKNTRVYDITTSVLNTWVREMQDKLDSLQERCQAYTAAPPVQPRFTSERRTSLHPRPPARSTAPQETPAAHRPDPALTPHSLESERSTLAGDARLRIGQSFQQSVATALYLALESIAYRTGAERASILAYVPRTDELQGVAVVGSGNLKPNQIRISAHSGVAGAVFGSGVALNMANAYADDVFDLKTDKKTGYRTRTILCFPIRGVQARSPIGVVQLLNKCRGTVNFTPEDESNVHSQVGLLAYIMQRYPVDLTANFFDTRVLHAVVPFEPVGPDDPNGLPNIMQSAGPQLIYRTSQSGQYLRKQTLAQHGLLMTASAGLKEVDEYICNLEDCWKQQVSLNVQYEIEKERKRMLPKS